jgi:hypothetical protein
VGDKFIAFRPKGDDKEIVETIREHLIETSGEDRDSAVIRFALRKAVKGLPKPTK